MFVEVYCVCGISLAELLPVFHQVHLLTSSMVHFIGQMQYYITFEVQLYGLDVSIKVIILVK